MSDRVALVTGGTGDIGGAIATALDADGICVAIHYHRNAERAEALAATLRCAAAFRADVRIEDQVAAMVADVTARLGTPTILVNAAGILSDAFVTHLKEASWDDCLDVCLKGAFLCIKHVAPHMARARWGRIVNISSVAGLVGDASRGNYSAAKAGLLGLTKAVARELGRGGVTVNAVCPGLIESRMVDGMGEARARDLLARIPMRRFGTPQEVASLVRYLVSDEASYITGATITVDGGLAM